MRIGQVIASMITYLRGDVNGVNHFLKVYAYAKAIGEQEKLDEVTQETLEVAAIVHDIGIPVSMAKYGSHEGRYQEIEGPPVAKMMLSDLGFAGSLIERVAFLVGHHHTYSCVDGLDYQILLEADFLVNADEGNLSRNEIEVGMNKFFKTRSGIEFLKINYLS